MSNEDNNLVNLLDELLEDIHNGHHNNVHNLIGGQNDVHNGHHNYVHILNGHQISGQNGHEPQNNGHGLHHGPLNTGHGLHHGPENGLQHGHGISITYPPPQVHTVFRYIRRPDQNGHFRVWAIPAMAIKVQYNPFDFGIPTVTFENFQETHMWQYQPNQQQPTQQPVFRFQNYQRFPLPPFQQTPLPQLQQRDPQLHGHANHGFRRGEPAFQVVPINAPGSQRISAGMPHLASANPSAQPDPTSAQVDGASALMDPTSAQPDKELPQPSSSTSSQLDKSSSQLEREFECVVCLDIPQIVYNCSHGHIVCGKCMERLHSNFRCPVCREDFGGWPPNRNTAMERVIRTFK